MSENKKKAQKSAYIDHFYTSQYILQDDPNDRGIITMYSSLFGSFSLIFVA